MRGFHLPTKPKAQQALSAFSACIALLLATASPRFTLAEDLRQLPPVIKELISQKSGIPIDAPDFIGRLSERRAKINDDVVRQSIAKAYDIDPASVDLQKMFIPNARKSAVPQKTDAHYVFAEGPPLEKEKVASGSATARILSQDFSPQIDQIKSGTLRTTKQLSTPRPIHSCMQDRTSKSEFRSNSSGEPPASDILVIAGKAPLNGDELYGKATKIIEYRPGDSTDNDSILVSMAEPECLPYRVRLLKGMRLEYYGAYALRNFDEHPAGAGKVAHKVKK